MKSIQIVAVSLLTAFLFAPGCSSPEQAAAASICGCYQDALELPPEEMRAGIQDCATQSKEIKNEHRENEAATLAIKSATEACMKPLHAEMAQKSRAAKAQSESPRTATRRRSAKHRPLEEK